MGSTEGHLQIARREKNNFLACAESEHGNTHGMIQHASLTVEHLLKALLAMEDDGHTDTRGHSLGGFLQRVQTDVSPFENFVYDIDGMYTQARYDEGFSSGLMRDEDRVATELKRFINYVETVYETRNA